ncbi:MAG: hypothetical protein WCF08_09415 [Anaerolineaceae bacterium]
MTKRDIGSFVVLITLLAMGMGAFMKPERASASGVEAGVGPNRMTTIKVSYTTYEWWLVTWRDNQVACQVYVEHEGLPDPGEIYYYCGQAVYDTWRATQPCKLGTREEQRQCSGYYFHLYRTTPGEREIEVKLAPAKAWLTLSGCEPTYPENRCSSLPKLLITGEEPLPNEQIISVQGLLNGEPFSCRGGACEIPLPPTGTNGIPLEFWVESSYGDSSINYTAQLRVIPWGDFMDPEGGIADQPAWYVDVISTQWRGSPLASCSQVWMSFPDVGGPPAWLLTPKTPGELQTTISYYYLAGSLIQRGVVDVSACQDGGLSGYDVASPCGLERAMPQVLNWQNQFDSEIIRIATETGVPAQLMKNIFGRESQFWPGIFKTLGEAGLGQMTEGGADTVLLWNPDFFSQFCPLVYKTDVCQAGFGNLTEPQQNTLRGALVQKVNAACPGCPTGIDLSQANFSISVFARALLANCEQVGQILYNRTGTYPGQVSSYVDLWKFTLTNYNAGPGCLADAITDAMAVGDPLDWEHVLYYLKPACQGAVDYVSDITSGIQVATDLLQLSNKTGTSIATPTITPQP